MVFPPKADAAVSSLPHAVHLTQLYELLLALLGIPLCLFIVKKSRAKTGGLFFLYAVWFCTMRLIVHPLRDLPYSLLVREVIYPVLYYVLIVFGIFLFVWSCRRGRS